MMLEHELTLEHRVSAIGSYDRYMGLLDSCRKSKAVSTVACQSAVDWLHRAREVLIKTQRAQGAWAL